jgi:imidazolonepropionase-like amidohydrolase
MELEVARILFNNARLVDGTGKPPVPGCSVLVEGERIVAVASGGAPVEPAEGDICYDLAGRTLMPGMINGHAHLSYPNFDPDDLNSIDMAYPPTHMAVIAAKNAEVTLKAGFTAAAGAGSVHQIDRMLKDLTRSGVIQGPRIMACGQDVMPTAGGMDLKPSWWHMRLSGLPLIVDGPIEVRKAVRQQAKEGNDLIKIYPQGGHGVPVRGSMDMRPDEIEAAVEAAHDKGKLVRAHVVTKAAIMLCINAGVDIIDHGSGIDDEVAELAAKRNVFFLPSLYMASIAPHYYAPRGDSMAAEDRIAAWFDSAARKLARAQAIGVKFVVGDDFGSAITPHGDNGKELAVYVRRLGLDPLDVLGWATSNGAEMMRKGHEFGTIEKGKLADLLVVDGDPVADIDLLGDPANLAVVMQGGRFITNRLAVPVAVTQ